MGRKLTAGIPAERLTLTVEEAAELLGIGRGTAYEAVRLHQIPSVRVGRRILVPRAALMAMLGAASELTQVLTTSWHPGLLDGASE